MPAALWPVLALGVNAVCVIVFFRAGLPLLRAVYAACFCGFLSLCAGLACGIAAPDFLANVVIYGALSYCHFHFINLGETARRIRILRELDESDGGLSREELLSRYNARDMLSVRLERLAGNGQLHREGGRYFQGAPAVLAMARVLDLLKALLLGRSGGENKP